MTKEKTIPPSPCLDHRSNQNSHPTNGQNRSIGRIVSTTFPTEYEQLYAPKRIITKKNITVAIASHIEVLIHNGFFWRKFLYLFEIEQALGDKATKEIFIPLILLVMTGTTITFVTSILPAVTDTIYDKNDNINDFIIQCRNAITFEAMCANPKQNKEILFYIDSEIRKKLKINQNKLNEIINKIKLFPDLDDKISIRMMRSKQNLNDLIQGNGRTGKKERLIYFDSISPKISKTLKQHYKLIRTQFSLPIRILADLFFKWTPTAISFISFFLATNYILQFLLGPINEFSIFGLWLIETPLTLLCATKTYITYKRKFDIARMEFESFVYFLMHADQKNQLEKKYLNQFIWTVVLPNIAAVSSYSMTTFFFVRHGCIEALHQVLFALFGQTYEYDVENPQLPAWQYYVAGYLVFNSFGTMLFTQVPTSWKQYKVLINQIAYNVKYKKTWKFSEAGIAGEAGQTLIQIFVSVAVTVATLSKVNLISPGPLTCAAFLSLGSAISYFHFQRIFGKKNFDFTCENLLELKSWLKKIFCCSPCMNHSKSSYSLSDKPTSIFSCCHREHHGYRRISEGDRDDETPGKAPRNWCTIC